MAFARWLGVANWPINGILMNMRILVIDDTPAIREVVSGLLGDMCEVDEANDGIQAYLKAKSGEYDVALMDIRMPNFDGIDAAQSIRDLERNAGRTRMPIIAMSAEMTPHLARECIAAGMDDYVAKPFDRAELREKIQRCISA